MTCLICWMDWSPAGVFGSGLVSGILSYAHHSGFVVCGGAWVASHAWYTCQCSSEVKKVDMNWQQSSQLGWWLCMMLVKSSNTACGSSEYAGVCCCQFRRLVVVKGWYMYCMGLATYDPSAWGNGSPGAWCRGIALQPGFLPPCLLASQSSVTFPNGLYFSPVPSRQRGV
jgi:hypothetical protein